MSPKSDDSTESVVGARERQIRVVADLGRLLRHQRELQKLGIHHAATLAGYSLRFVQDLEAGKPTIQMGRALDYAAKLGVSLHARPTQSSEHSI